MKAARTELSGKILLEAEKDYFQGARNPWGVRARNIQDAWSASITYGVLVGLQLY